MVRFKLKKKAIFRLSIALQLELLISSISENVMMEALSIYLASVTTRGMLSHTYRTLPRLLNPMASLRKRRGVNQMLLSTMNPELEEKIGLVPLMTPSIIAPISILKIQDLSLTLNRVSSLSIRLAYLRGKKV